MNERSYPSDSESHALDDNLVLRTACTLADVERIAVFNATVHSDEEVAAYTRWKLAGGHPEIRLSDAVLVEDKATGKIVSSLCSFPQTWLYEGVALPVREIALVGTDAVYRKRGLIRAQMRYVHSQMRAGGSLLGCIEGIPGFYRQFGYEFAVPLGSCARLSQEKLPIGGSSPMGSLRVRPIDLDRDLPAVIRLYQQSASQLQVLADRSQALWQYLEAAPPGVPDRQETWVVESGRGVVAYVRLRKNMWGPWLELAEMCVETLLSSSDRAAVYEATLHSARSTAVERAYQGLCFALDPRHELLEEIEKLGPEPERQYAWQVKVIDAVELLKRIAPVLERRLVESDSRECSRVLDINLMSRVIRLTLEQGRVAGVVWLSDRVKSECELRLSEHQFVQLVLGYRDYATLMDSSLDAWVHPGIRDLVGILFPRLRSFVNGAN